ncbi:MAG: TIGR02444 family protein [Halomonas sp.]|nr:TIGR02444 family protein [Halomonas sp.]
MAGHSTQSPFALTAPDSLWRYACAHYADPVVAAACLDLQERAGADVCELLWLGWLDQLELAPRSDVMHALAPVRRHQARQTYPLRARRRALKPLARPGSALDAWRERLKRDELAAERIALELLQALTRQGVGVRPLSAADGDLASRLARHLGPSVDTADNALMRLANGLKSQPFPALPAATGPSDV